MARWPVASESRDADYPRVPAFFFRFYDRCRAAEGRAMTEVLVHPRIREITDALGDRLRVSVEPHPTGALVTIQRTGLRGSPRIVLDGFGAEVLSGYIMSARLTLPGSLPPERVDGPFPSSISLSHAPATALVMSEPTGGRRFEIPVTFWDRLFAELCIVNAHARELTRRAKARMQ